jgi:hypothetical protein
MHPLSGSQLIEPGDLSSRTGDRFFDDDRHAGLQQLRGYIWSKVIAGADQRKIQRFAG